MPYNIDHARRVVSVTGIWIDPTGKHVMARETTFHRDFFKSGSFLDMVKTGSSQRERGNRGFHDIASTVEARGHGHARAFLDRRERVQPRHHLLIVARDIT